MGVFNPLLPPLLNFSSLILLTLLSIALSSPFPLPLPPPCHLHCHFPFALLYFFISVILLHNQPMKPINRLATHLVRESEKPYKSLEDRSLVFKLVKLPRHRWRRRGLYHKVYPSRQLPVEIARIREKARLARLVNLRKKILQFLTTRCPTIEDAKGIY